METKINDLVLEARQGDNAALKYLLNRCKKESLPLSVQYFYKAKKLNYDYSDLRELVIPAFFDAINKYDPFRSEFFDFFKFIYLCALKELIKEAKMIRYKEDLSEFKDSEERIYCDTGNISNVDYHLARVNDEERIYNMIFKEGKVNLTKKERSFLQMYAEGQTYKEISNNLNKDYKETRKTVISAIGKVRNYIDNQWH